MIVCCVFRIPVSSVWCHRVEYESRN